MFRDKLPEYDLLVDNFLALKVKSKSTRYKIKRMLQNPNVFNWGEKPSIFYVESSESFEKYQVTLKNDGKLHCHCKAVQFGSKTCVHCVIVELLLYLDKKSKNR